MPSSFNTYSGQKYIFTCGTCNTNWFSNSKHESKCPSEQCEGIPVRFRKILEEEKQRFNDLFDNKHRLLDQISKIECDISQNKWLNS